MMGNGVEEIFNNLSDLDKTRLINYLLHSMYQPVFIPSETECKVVAGVMHNGKEFFIQNSDYRGTEE